MLLSIHLGTNHAAVRSVSMRSLNRQRANIVLSHLLASKRALTPEEVSFQERIFERDGVLRWQGSVPIARASIGVSLQSLLHSLGPAHNVTGAIRDKQSILQRLVRTFDKEDYLLWYDAPQKAAFIVLKEAATPGAQIKAWALSLLVAHRFSEDDATAAVADKTLYLLEVLLMELTNQWDKCIERMKTAGWDVDVANLETASDTTRIRHQGMNDESAKTRT